MKNKTEIFISEVRLEKSGIGSELRNKNSKILLTYIQIDVKIILVHEKSREQKKYRGIEQLAARRAHNPKVVGSSPTPATKNF